MSGYDQDKEFVVAETRRKWSTAERLAIVAETGSAAVSSVARKHGVAASLLFRWRRDAGCSGKWKKQKASAAFVPVALPVVATPSARLPDPHDRGVIEIILSSGHRVRVDTSVDVAALKRVIAALDAR